MECFDQYFHMNFISHGNQVVFLAVSVIQMLFTGNFDET